MLVRSLKRLISQTEINISRINRRLNELSSTGNYEDVNQT